MRTLQVHWIVLMLSIPDPLRDNYLRLLSQREVPAYTHNAYLKWLRFYLDFCHKYHHNPGRRNSLPPFIGKLDEKNQTPRQQKQASHGINLYYALSGDDATDEKTKQAPGRSSPAVTPEKAAWQRVYTGLDVAIKVRHYSPKTYKTYASWVRKFQSFTHGRLPQSLAADDLKSFVNYLAIKRKGRRLDSESGP